MLSTVYTYSRLLAMTIFFLLLFFSVSKRAADDWPSSDDDDESVLIEKVGTTHVSFILYCCNFALTFI